MDNIPPAGSALTSTVVDYKGTEELMIEGIQAKKPPSEKDIRNLRRQFITVRNPMVLGCEHKIDIDREPKNNCPICWFAFFQNNGEATQTVEKAFQENKIEFLIKWKGKKFTKNFLCFMDTVAKIKIEEETKNEQPVQSTEGLDEGQGSGDTSTNNSYYDSPDDER